MGAKQVTEKWFFGDSSAVSPSAEVVDANTKPVKSTMQKLMGEIDAAKAAATIAQPVQHDLVQSAKQAPTSANVNVTSVEAPTTDALVRNTAAAWHGVDSTPAI